MSPRQQYWLSQYESIIHSEDLSHKTGTANIFTHESVYITENDGTQRFFESLRENAEKIAEKLEKQKKSDFKFKKILTLKVQKPKMYL